MILELVFVRLFSKRYVSKMITIRPTDITKHKCSWIVVNARFTFVSSIIIYHLNGFELFIMQKV